MKPKRYRYQLQYACFECRKSFKRPYEAAERFRTAWLSKRISGRNPTKPFAEPSFRCPDCNGETMLMGRAFRAPRHDDVDRWRAAEILTRAGFGYWSSVGDLPETVTEARRFVEERQKLSDGAKLAKKIRKQTA